MSNKISTLVGLKNNLEYTKNFYKTFRQIYPTDEIVFVSYGSNDGTNSWLFNLNDPNTITFFEEEGKTFSDTYNKAIELATKDFVVFAHNDMVVAPGFLENIEKYAHKDRVISYNTTEPPIFTDHERPGKIIRNFGEGVHSFDDHKFFEFARKELTGQFKDGTSDGVSFFMCLSRQVLLDIGGFDNIFNPYFSEDDDLIKRLKLKGLKCFTSLDSIVYHFVSKTSRFSEEAKTKTQQIERNSNRTYLRKWGSMNSQNRFNVAFVVENCSEQLLEALEPWCDRIYWDDPYGIIIDRYIQKEQPNTCFELNKRIYTLNNDPELENDIIVSFDGSKLDNNQFEIIRNLQNILGNVSPNETYEIGIFNIKANIPINNIEQLIFINK